MCADVEDKSEFNFVYEQSPATAAHATTPPHTTDSRITPPSHREFEAHDRGRVRRHSGDDALTTSAAAAAVLQSRQLCVVGRVGRLV